MKSIVVIGLVLGIATGCTTTSKTKKRKLKTSDVYKKSAVVESISGGTVVQQLSGQNGYKLEKRPRTSI